MRSWPRASRTPLRRGPLPTGPPLTGTDSAITTAWVSECPPPDVSVVLPTYEEADALPALVPRILETLTEAGLAAEVIVVDDDSPDRTWQVAEQLAERWPVQVIRRRGDRGLAYGEVREVFRRCQGLLRLG